MNKLIVLLAFICLINQACKDAADTINLSVDTTNPYKPVIKIAGKKVAAARVKADEFYSLSIVMGDSASNTNIICEETFKDDTLYITPLFTLGSELTFSFKVYPKTADEKEITFSTPANENSSSGAAVKSVYPLTDTIPANLLMFHVVFNTTMSEDPKAYRKVMLLNQDGYEMNMVWREKSNWTDEGKHLVLMVHPGRIKRGIRYMSDSGELFIPGNKYTLVITEGIKDKDGNTLVNEYRKTYYITPEDREIPEFNKQATVIPEAGTRDALIIAFNDKMDYGAMQIGIELTTTGNKELKCVVTSVNEKEWQIVPEAAWQKGNYTLTLNDYVIDLGSNHLTRRFEETEKDRMKKREGLTYRFTVK